MTEIKNFKLSGMVESVNNPVLVAGDFQYKVKVFFKEIIPDYPLGKTKYAIRIEFQERRSPVVHSFIWMYINAPNIQNEDVCIEFTEKAMNAWLPDHFSDPELFELVKTFQVHAHCGTYWKYNKNECRLSYG